MKYNQFSFIPRPIAIAEQELQALGFDITHQQADKKALENFCRKIFFNYKDTDYPLRHLIAVNGRSELKNVNKSVSKSAIK